MAFNSIPPAQYYSSYEGEDYGRGGYKHKNRPTSYKNRYAGEEYYEVDDYGNEGYKTSADRYDDESYGYEEPSYGGDYDEDYGYDGHKPSYRDAI